MITHSFGLHVSPLPHLDSLRLSAAIATAAGGGSFTHSHYLSPSPSKRSLASKSRPSLHRNKVVFFFFFFLFLAPVLVLFSLFFWDFTIVYDASRGCGNWVFCKLVFGGRKVSSLQVFVGFWSYFILDLGIWVSFLFAICLDQRFDSLLLQDLVLGFAHLNLETYKSLSVLMYRLYYFVWCHCLNAVFLCCIYWFQCQVGVNIRLSVDWHCSDEIKRRVKILWLLFVNKWFSCL